MPLPDASLERIFRSARTYNGFSNKPVTDETLRQAYDLLRWGPTSANSSPGRFVFVKSKAAKEKLRPALSEGNLNKRMAAPVTAIVAYDTEFYEKLPKLFPHTDARSWFAGKPALIESNASRNGTLQGAYMIIAARALGVLPRRQVEIQLPVQPGLRRSGERQAAESAAILRGRLPDRMTRGQSMRSYAGSVRNSTKVSLLTRSAKIPAASS